MIKLPDWKSISDKKDREEELNPIEHFIFENDPAGNLNSNVFMEDFTKALEYYKQEIIKEIKTHIIHVDSTAKDTEEIITFYHGTVQNPVNNFKQAKQLVDNLREFFPNDATAIKVIK